MPGGQGDAFLQLDLPRPCAPGLLERLAKRWEEARLPEVHRNGGATF